MCAVPPDATVFVDGACSGNPGPYGIGVVILDNSGGVVKELSAFGGPQGTNNIAEYTGATTGMRLAKELGIKNLKLCSDSLLVVNQLLGRWTVRSPHLQQFHQDALGIMKQFDSISVAHIGRSLNSRADALARAAVAQYQAEAAATAAAATDVNPIQTVEKE